MRTLTQTVRIFDSIKSSNKKNTKQNLRANTRSLQKTTHSDKTRYDAANDSDDDNDLSLDRYRKNQEETEFE
jgi:hypothetical protein